MPRKTRKAKLRTHTKPAVLASSKTEKKTVMHVSNADTQVARDTIRDILKTVVIIALLLALQAAVYYAQTHGMLARFFK